MMVLSELKGQMPAAASESGRISGKSLNVLCSTIAPSQPKITIPSPGTFSIRLFFTITLRFGYHLSRLADALKLIAFLSVL